MTSSSLRTPLLAGLALLVALLLAACGGNNSDAVSATSGSSSGSAGASGGSGRLVVDIATPPASLDPAIACSLEDIGLVSDLYVTLVKHEIVGSGTSARADYTRVAPYLAQSWSVSKDRRSYTFRLNPDARFPSGRPTDAAAVKYSFERAQALGACGANFANAANPTPLVKSVTTPDATTVVFTLNRPDSNFLQALTSPSLGIVDPSVIDAHGGVRSNTPNEWLASHSAGSGPYTLASYDAGTKAVYKANPTFFGEQPKTAEVEINFVPSDPTLLLKARSGEADVTIGLTKQSVASLRDDDAVKIVDTPAANWQLVSFPTQQKPFDDAKLREALTYAIPYEDLLQRVAYGYGATYYGPFPPAFAAFDSEIEAPRRQDVARARQLIAESGVRTPISLPLYIRDGANDQQQIATVVQDAFKQLGVDVKIQKLAAAAYQNAVGAPRKTYALVRQDGPSIPNPAWLASYDLRCRSPYNVSNYCSPEAERLLDEATLLPVDQQQPYWDRIARIWVADSPRAPIYAQDDTTVVKADVTDFTFAQNDLLFHRWGR